MNTDKFNLFSEAYRAALVIAYNEHPEKYILPADGDISAINNHANRILNEIFRNPKGVLYTSDAFKIVCKAFGIKFTRKAIFEFLEIDK